MSTESIEVSDESVGRPAPRPRRDGDEMTDYQYHHLTDQIMWGFITAFLIGGFWVILLFAEISKLSKKIERLGK